MRFLEAKEYQRRAVELFDAVAAEIHACLRDARVEHIGASSVPGAVSKGDLDVFVGVPRDGFEKATRLLEGLGYRQKPGTLQTDALRMLETAKHGSDVAIQLVENGSRFEMFLTFRDLLRRDPGLLRRYNEMKLACSGLGEDAYRERKSAFIERILSTAG